MADEIMADAAVELRNVSSGYGETVVLEDLNLKVAPGESISVIGRNGVGKTTLLATVMGHTTLHKGEVAARRQEPQRRADLPPRRRRHRLRAAGARDFPFAHACARTSTSARGPAHGPTSACSSCSRTSPSASPTRATSFSGGEQQMLSIARALRTNPSVLLMDEPTEGLAPVIVEALTAVLVRLRSESKLSIILVEQNSRVAFEFSDRSVVMDKGRIVYDGASKTLRDDPERLAQLIGVSE